MSKKPKAKFGIFTKRIHVSKLAKALEEAGISKGDAFISTLEGDWGSNEDVSRLLNEREFDVGVSYCFPRIIDLSQFPEGVRWFNYHPAILPEYKGMSCYDDAIRDGVTEYAATLHLMVQDFDSGPIIQKRKFDLERPPIDVNELGNITHYHLFQLFRDTIRDLETQSGTL